jgi:hypothetical protein
MIAAAFVAFGIPGIASAESDTSLSKQGYAVGKLGQGKSSSLGCVLSKGRKMFFCRPMPAWQLSVARS